MCLQDLGHGTDTGVFAWHDIGDGRGDLHCTITPPGEHISDLVLVLSTVGSVATRAAVSGTCQAPSIRTRACMGAARVAVKIDPGRGCEHPHRQAHPDDVSRAAKHGLQRPEHLGVCKAVQDAADLEAKVVAGEAAAALAAAPSRTSTACMCRTHWVIFLAGAR